jgi:hypothetical protein
VWSPLWREDRSVFCSAVSHWYESRRTPNHILLFHLRLPQPGRPSPRIYIPQEQGGPVISPGTWFLTNRKLKLKLIYDRRSVGQSALLSGYHLEPMTRFLFSVRQLQVSCCGEPFLTRGRVSNLFVHLLLGLGSAVTLESKIRRTQIIFYCLIWDSPNLDGEVLVFISPRNRVAQLYPRALGSLFFASYDSQGYGGVILTRLQLLFLI